ncbi:VOC family protein [Methylopila sp. M107]|uniref:VOC family protein n=1 Tax=Methylopila sp. M107 TaxID=1101190 RepID=UPI0003613002|nr:VOC family protein [Methylopila sp. M107]
MHVEPYLFFGGNAEEALDFYETALGAERVMVMRFKESPEQPPEGAIPDNWGEKIMHACIKVGDTNVMLSDGCGSADAQGFAGVSLTLQVKDAAEAARLYGALTDGGSIVMPLGPTFFSPAFGMLKDRFGVAWGIVAEAEAAARAA